MSSVWPIPVALSKVVYSDLVSLRFLYFFSARFFSENLLAKDSTKILKKTLLKPTC